MQTTVGVRGPATSSDQSATSESIASGSTSVPSPVSTTLSLATSVVESSPSSGGGSSLALSEPTTIPKYSKNLSATIAASTSVPLGAGLVAALVYLWFHRKRRKKRLREEEDNKRKETIRWGNDVELFRQALASEPQEMDTRWITRRYSKPELSDDSRRAIFEVAGHLEGH